MQICSVSHLSCDISLGVVIEHLDLDIAIPQQEVISLSFISWVIKPRGNWQPNAHNIYLYNKANVKASYCQDY